MKWLEHRIPPPVIALIAVVTMWQANGAWPEPSATANWQWAGLIVCALTGLVFDLSAVVSFIRRHTTVNPLKPASARHLVTSGLYRISRNPMYLGLAFNLAAVGFWFGHWSAWLVLPVFILYVTRFQIIPEERALQQRFGTDFTSYRDSVRRWL